MYVFSKSSAWTVKCACHVRSAVFLGGAFHALPPPLPNMQLKETARSTGYETTYFLLFAWIMAGGTQRPLFWGLVKQKTKQKKNKHESLQRQQ